MENQNDLLRMISQALQNSQEVQQEIVRLLKGTTLPTPVYRKVEALLKTNSSLLGLIAESTPQE